MRRTHVSLHKPAFGCVELYQGQSSICVHDHAKKQEDFMSIAVIHNHPIHYQHLLFQEMKRLGLNFDVLFQASQSSIRYEQIGLDQNTYRCRIGFHGPYEQAPPILKARWTWSALQEIRPKIILVSSYYATECWSCWLWALIHRVPVVMWFESNEFDYPRNLPKETLKRIFLKGLVGAHVYGASSKEYLVKLGLDPRDIVTKRAVVDVARFTTNREQKAYRAGGVTRLIYVGRLAPIKNVSQLVNAFASASAVAQGPLRLIIAGSGPCEAELRSQVSRLGLDRSVEFKGYVSQKDLPELYRQADFFVLPSTREPWGLVALEAMLCRLPILTSTQCGCTADLVNGDTGWSFSPWDVTQLTNLIEALPAIPLARLEEMAEAAHALAVTYSPENTAATIRKSIAEIRDRSSRIRSSFTTE